MHSYESKTRPQLILDAGGVIATNFLLPYWVEIAKVTGIPCNKLESLFKQEIRVPLWTGKISESEFWLWLHKLCPNLETEMAKNLFYRQLKPLPVVEHLVKWSKYADIHILSNHRAEWLTPILKPYLSYFKSITISSEVGSCKNSPKIYEYLHAQLDNSQFILFIDDQERNMGPAEDLGWNTLIADREGNWIEQVAVQLIEQQASSISPYK